MQYLERNKSIVRELADVNLTQGVEIGKSSRTSFVAVGNYESPTLGRTLHLGFKFPLSSSFTYFLEDQFVFQLGVVNAIATNFPDLEPALPAFLCLLKGKDGEPRGILTEDFTKGRERILENHGYIPHTVKGLFVEGSIVDDHFEGMAIRVYDPVEYPDFPPGEIPQDYPIPQREDKLVDFYPLIDLDFREAHKQKFNEAEIEKELGRHTLMADIS